MFRILCFCLSSVLLIAHAHSKDTNIKFSGFATFAATYNSNKALEFRPDFLNEARDGFSLGTDSKLGGQVNVSMGPNWDAVAQMVLQDRSFGNLENYLELAFVRYRPSRNFAIRVGRLNSDLYLISEYPSVSYAYLWFRPPYEFYSFASTAGRVDGADIEYNTNIRSGYLRVKLAAGQSSPSFDDGSAELSFTFSDSINLSVSYQIESLLLRASHSRTTIRDLESVQISQFLTGLRLVPQAFWPEIPNIINGIDGENKSIVFNAIGASYEVNNWQFQSEMSSLNTDWLIFPSSYAAYISAGYTVGNTTYFATVSGVRNKDEILSFNRPDLPQNAPEFIRVVTEELYTGLTDTLSGTAFRQATFSIGAKHHIFNNAALKIQLDHSDISPNGGGLWSINNTDIEKTRQKANVLSIGLSLVF